MGLFIVLVILINITICVLGFTNFYKKIKYNINMKEKNEELEKNCHILSEQYNKIKKETDKQLEQLNNYNLKLNEMESNVQQSFVNYCDILDADYKLKEEEYNKLAADLKLSYDNKYDELAVALSKINADLDKMKRTRAAALEARRKEKKIEENLQFYSISIEAKDRNDIQILERMKKDLNNPRILSMLIWQNFFRDKMTELCNNILGIKETCGIYKITNQITKECYIGQSNNVSKRFKEHAKCGLGIDTPFNNKLYKAIEKYKLWNFTFELLEECPREQLNEKEKFYIELYQSNDYGYNGNKRDTKIENIDY